jgi:hypothetical protein
MLFSNSLRAAYSGRPIANSSHDGSTIVPPARECGAWFGGGFGRGDARLVRRLDVG